MASEPLPNEFDPEDVRYLAEVLEEAISEFCQENPGLECPIEAEEEAGLLRRRAETKTHDVRPEDMRNIIQAARESGCPQGAITAIVREI